MKNGLDMFKALKWIAAIVIACGIICSAVHITEFSDSNLGLMIGIGFLFGGVQIWMFSAIAGLLLRSGEQQAKPSEERS
ncbi:hypothetical protein COLU111180_03915 [Cohnella lubricantis]|uniref:Uncharacterized protein n=1 Tax=Cohnella lubricantis TaxID=2163172 RepID=A0A841TBV0_9BACL|nr:hypothetical protein [Cohnella lubricantis]MBB6676710.1 hypothetical protein [Cohnella lubricantis]MBP2117756.1 EamA domain-containing membrane protein RarD [Cohnella lubricantis]